MPVTLADGRFSIALNRWINSAVLMRPWDHIALFNECARLHLNSELANSMAAKIFHPLLALIASASNNELARYVEFMKAGNKILRARVPGQIHTRPDERSRLVKLGKALGQAIEELITLVAPLTFYRWCREAESGKKKAIPKDARRHRNTPDPKCQSAELSASRCFKSRVTKQLIARLSFLTSRGQTCGDMGFKSLDPTLIQRMQMLARLRGDVQ